MTVPSRREFLSAAAAGAAAMTLPSLAAATPRLSPGTAKSCIFINMVGGPAHLDTFDPKPDAPAEYRGPFRPIQTKVPGLHLSELFPKLAAVADKFSLVRSMHHTAPPIHEAGFQLLNTGRLFRDGPEWPSVGAVVSRLRNQHLGNFPAWCIVPHADINTGIQIDHGQGCGWLSASDCGSLTVSAADIPDNWSFALSCSMAFGLVQAGHRFVTLNQFSTVFDSPSWDCHSDGGSLRTNLNDIRDTVARSFDIAFAQLLTDLDERGLLD